jgi:D-sedoheptulose 7-phosphate isomerase
MKYYDDLHKAIVSTYVTVKGQGATLVELSGAADVARYLALHKRGAIGIVGNGGSSTIASHVATDLIKRGVAATAFDDPAILTCLANDYGYADVYARQVRAWATKLEMLIAISSSGRSENILRAAEAAKNAGIFVMTFSGFASGNLLRQMGDVNVWTPSSSYGHVELAHMAILHDAVERLPELDVVKKASEEAPTETGFARASAMAHGDVSDRLANFDQYGEPRGGISEWLANRE